MADGRTSRRVIRGAIHHDRVVTVEKNSHDLKITSDRAPSIAHEFSIDGVGISDGATSGRVVDRRIMEFAVQRRVLRRLTRNSPTTRSIVVGDVASATCVVQAQRGRGARPCGARLRWIRGRQPRRYV